jgi:hypothetical protein
MLEKKLKEYAINGELEDKYCAWIKGFDRAKNNLIRRGFMQELKRENGDIYYKLLEN